MTKKELIFYVGRNVCVYFKGEEKGIYGQLGYADQFAAKHGYRKPNYFYIGNTSFKASHVRKLSESEDKHE